MLKWIRCRQTKTTLKERIWRPIKLYNAEKEASSNQKEDDYDPHLHRYVPHPTNNLETMIHLVKGSIGIGILAMPEAFKNAGWVNGLVCTIIIGIVCTYCLHILINAKYVMCKRLKVPNLTYPESMKIALQSGPHFLSKFANMSPLLVNVFMIVNQLGTCSVYIIFVGANVKAVVDHYLPKEINLKLYIVASFILFALIMCVKSLKLLTPFSAFANILVFISFGIVWHYIFKDLHNISERKRFGSLNTFPLFFGTTLFAVEAVGVVIAIENNMQTPKSFGGYFGVYNTTMIMTVMLQITIGCLGYLRYGDQTESSITLNFPPTDILAQIVKILYSIIIFISYALQGYVPIQIMWDNYVVQHLSNSKHITVWEYVLRLSAVIATFALALSSPLLGIFISLLGAVFSSALGIVFPAVIKICVYWPESFGQYYCILIKDVLLILFGVLGMLAGSYSCFSGIF